MKRIFLNVLGNRIDVLDLESAIGAARARLSSGLGGYVCFVNVHTATEARADAGFRGVLNGSFLSCPDGVPLVWLALLKGGHGIRRVCGPDFMADVLRSSPQEVFGFVGGAPGVAERISASFGVSGVHYSPPVRPFSPENAREDWEAFRSLCGESAAPRWIWVGLGAPKQEQWMQVVSALAPNTLFFGVGAAFDFLAGTKSRSPRWMQKMGLEWLYRLGSEPRRLFFRYLSTNLRFCFYVVHDLITKES